MKHTKAFLAALLLTALLLFCAGAQAGGRLMPLVSIKTVDKKEGTRFVTEPVKGNVSAAIASWTPNYKIPPEPLLIQRRGRKTSSAGTTSTPGSWAATASSVGLVMTAVPTRPSFLSFRLPMAIFTTSG